MLRKSLIVVSLLAILPVLSLPPKFSRRVPLPALSTVSSQFIGVVTNKLGTFSTLPIPFKTAQEAKVIEWLTELWSVHSQEVVSEAFKAIVSGDTIPFKSYAYPIGFVCGLERIGFDSAQAFYEFLLRQKIEGSQLLIAFLFGVLDGYCYACAAASKRLVLSRLDVRVQEAFGNAFTHPHLQDYVDFAKASRVKDLGGEIVLNLQNIALIAGLDCLLDWDNFERPCAARDVSLSARMLRIHEAFRGGTCGKFTADQGSDALFGASAAKSVSSVDMSSSCVSFGPPPPAYMNYDPFMAFPGVQIPSRLDCQAVDEVHNASSAAVMTPLPPPPGYALLTDASPVGAARAGYSPVGYEIPSSAHPALLSVSVPPAGGAGAAGVFSDGEADESVAQAALEDDEEGGLESDLFVESLEPTVLMKCKAWIGRRLDDVKGFVARQLAERQRRRVAAASARLARIRPLNRRVGPARQMRQVVPEDVVPSDDEERPLQCAPLSRPVRANAGRGATSTRVAPIPRSEAVVRHIARPVVEPLPARRPVSIGVARNVCRPSYESVARRVEIAPQRRMISPYRRAKLWRLVHDAIWKKLEQERISCKAVEIENELARRSSGLDERVGECTRRQILRDHHNALQFRTAQLAGLSYADIRELVPLQRTAPLSVAARCRQRPREVVVQQVASRVFDSSVPLTGLRDAFRAGLREQPVYNPPASWEFCDSEPITVDAPSVRRSVVRQSVGRAQIAAGSLAQARMGLLASQPRRRALPEPALPTVDVVTRRNIGLRRVP